MRVWAKDGRSGRSEGTAAYLRRQITNNLLLVASLHALIAGSRTQRNRKSIADLARSVKDFSAAADVGARTSPTYRPPLSPNPARVRNRDNSVYGQLPTALNSPMIAKRVFGKDQGSEIKER